MSPDGLFIKALCRQIRERYGSNDTVALAAGVSPGVFSTYCSDDHRDLIPITRLKVIANRRDKATLIQWLTKGDGEPSDAAVLTEVCETTEAAASLQRATREALSDRAITPRERRELRGQAVHLVGSASGVIAALDGDAA